MTNGWENKAFGEVVEFQRGLTYSKKDEVDASANIVLRANNIDLTSNLLDLSELRHISDKIKVPASKKLKRDSLLICTASGSRSHLGKVALIDRDYDYAFGGFMGQLTAKPLLNPKYLFYFMVSDTYKKHIRGLSDGVNINNLKFDDLKPLKVPLPPLPEQQRIVDILDETFAGLAIAIANAQKNLTNASELFDAYLNSVFEEGWARLSLGEIAENLDSRRIPVTKRDRKSGDVPYYGASGAVDYVNDFIFDEILLLVSEDGANLVMRTYPIAFSISGKSWVNNHAHVLRFPDLASQKFVEYYLNSISLMPYVNGMAQPKLNQKALNSISVPWPELDERQKAAERLEELGVQTVRLREHYEIRISALTELKQSMLQKAFSGELTSPPSQAIKEAAE